MLHLWTQPWTTTEQLWTSIALLGVWLASLPTALEAFKKGNEADPLGREILRENEKADKRRAGGRKAGGLESSADQPLG